MPTDTARSKKKAPCGHCKEECTTGTSLTCAFCETGFHAKCIDGMTTEFLDSCDKMSRVLGGSVFLCYICRKLTARINKSFKEFDAKIAGLEERIKNFETRA